NPGVVPGRDLVDVTLVHLDLRAIVHQDVQRSGEHVAHVTVLAGGCPDHGLDVLRPTPTGLPGEPGDRRLVEVDDIDVPERERADDVRGGHQALPLQARHVRI